MPGQSAASVLVADALPIVRAGVRAVLAAQPDMRVVGETGHGPEVADLARRLGAGLVVCDAALLRGNGLAARLREDGRKVLVLSGGGEPRTVREVLAGGAAGCVLKRATTEQLVQAVRTVVGGGIYLDPELAGWVVDGLAGGDDGAGPSDREEQVLRLIAWGHSNKEIAAQLCVSVKSVETYKARAMEKLRVWTRSGIVAYAVGRGWLADGGAAAGAAG